MNAHRGLTLIEVLAATVLLGITAAACVPLLTSAMRVLHEDEVSAWTFDELGLIADDVLKNPEAFGLTTAQLRELGTVTAEVSDDEPGRSIAITRMSSDDAPRHAWQVFSAGEGDRAAAAFRWIALPKEVER